MTRTAQKRAPFWLTCLALWGCFLARPAAALDVDGVFLVAQPALAEPAFRHSVILLSQPPVGGPLGVVINRPTAIPLTEVLPEYPHIAALPQPLHSGGPVEPEGLVFLVRSPAAPPQAVRVLDNVYLTGNADWVEATLAAGEPAIEVRVFAGHAGWARGQLQNELQAAAWYLVPADGAAVFEGDIARLWPELARRAVLRSARSAAGWRMAYVRRR